MLSEYIPLLFVSIVAVSMLIKAFEGDKSLYLLSIIAIVIIFFLIRLSIQHTAKRNIQMFNNNKTLECIQQSYSSNVHYNVSLKNNWRVDKNYFVNDIYRIRANGCDEI